MKNLYAGLALFCLLLMTSTGLLGQSFAGKIFNEAFADYQKGNYQESINYINQQVDLQNQNDSLLYLKVLNYRSIYMLSADNTQAAENTIKLFLNKVRRYLFPDAAYNEVISFYSEIQKFKESDRAFFEGATKGPDINSIVFLQQEKNKVSNYLNSNKNTFYLRELNEISASLEKDIQKLLRLEEQQ